MGLASWTTTFQYSCFDSYVGWKIGCTMLKTSEFSLGIRMTRFVKIFDDKSRLTHATNELFPSVQVFGRFGFSIPGTGNGRQRMVAVIGFDEFISLCGRYAVSLKAARLFVLTDIDSSVNQDTCHLAVDR